MRFSATEVGFEDDDFNVYPPHNATRYPSEGDRAAAIAKAAQQLIRDRLVLEEDAGLFIVKSN